MASKLFHNYKLTRGIIVCLFRFQSLFSLCTLLLLPILRIYDHLLLHVNISISIKLWTKTYNLREKMLQSHSDVLIFRIDTFHIRRHKLLYFRWSISAPIDRAIDSNSTPRPCIFNYSLVSTMTTPPFDNNDDRVQGWHAP